MLMRLMDFLKENGVTSLFTSLSKVAEIVESEVRNILFDRQLDFATLREIFGKRHRDSSF